MRKTLFASIMLATACISFAPPAQAGNGGEVLGTFFGAGLGGLIGNQFGSGSGKTAATIGGVVLGGIAGNSIGASMDRRDRYYSRAGYYTPQSTQPYYVPPSTYYTPPYYSPPVNQRGYVPNYVGPPSAQPQQSTAYYNNEGRTYCREYTQQVIVNGHRQESYGTACLQPDGSWRVVR